MTAASTETANLLSSAGRTSTPTTPARCAGTTGSLHSDVAAKKAATQVDPGDRQVRPVGTGSRTRPWWDRPARARYIVLVTVNGYKSTTPTVPTQQNLQVTVQKVKGSWLASDVQNVGVS